MLPLVKPFPTKIMGLGRYLPKRVVSNDELAKRIDTTHEWIYSRTGIAQRHVSSTREEDDEYASGMAYKASLEAIEQAGIKPNDIDLIILATCTPDYKLPNTAVMVQQKLGINNHCACLDISTACSGFIYGLNMSHALIQMGMIRHALVIGSEMLSPQVDWEDRSICILFGDGAGAAVVGKTPEGEESSILSTTLGADGSGLSFLHQKFGASRYPINEEILKAKDHFIKMQGKEMFKVAVRTLSDNAKKVLELANYRIDQVDWLVPHQANIRIIEATADALNFPIEKTIINIDKYANTSAATVPLALYDGIADGRIQRGNVLLLDAFGAGLTTGATLLVY